jgi:hypothetical protein
VNVKTTETPAIALSSLRIADDEGYCAEFPADDGGTRTFTFRVESHRGINVVTWDKAFDDLRVRNPSLYTPFFEAVLALHRTRSLSAPK